MKKELRGFIASVLVICLILFSIPAFADVLTESDTTKPTVSSVEQYTGTSIKVFFSEQVDQITAETLANYAIAEKYGSMAPLDVTGAQLDASGTMVVLTTAPQRGAILYNITVNNVCDLADNMMDSAIKTFVGLDGGSITPDPTSPVTVESVQSISNTTVQVTFSGSVDKISAENIANYSIALKYGVRTPLPIVIAELDATGTILTLTTEAQQVGSLYGIQISGVKDTAGNIIANAVMTFVGR